MGLMIAASVLLVLLLVILLIALKTLLSRGWFVKWCRGTFGFLLLAVSVFIGLLAADMFMYFHATDGEVIATLSFKERSKQLYEVELMQPVAGRQQFELAGDQWQLDVKMLSMGNLFPGQTPSYKLDRISGRYLSLEQEQADIRTVYAVKQTDIEGVDTWYLASILKLSFLVAKQGSAAFMPMADGAIYQIKINAQGIRAEPVNGSAERAVSEWQ